MWAWRCGVFSMRRRAKLGQQLPTSVRSGPLSIRSERTWWAKVGHGHGQLESRGGGCVARRRRRGWGVERTLARADVGWSITGLEVFRDLQRLAAPKVFTDIPKIQSIAA